MFGSGSLGRAPETWAGTLPALVLLGGLEMHRAVGTAGNIVGNRLAALTPQVRLRQAFALFLVAMGVFVLCANIS